MDCITYPRVVSITSTELVLSGDFDGADILRFRPDHEVAVTTPSEIDDWRSPMYCECETDSATVQERIFRKRAEDELAIVKRQLAEANATITSLTS